MENVGERLKFAREKAGFPSARDAALRFGWKTSTYAAHENGQIKNIKPDVAKDYAKAFNCLASWLLTGEGQSPSVSHESVTGRDPNHPLTSTPPSLTLGVNQRQTVDSLRVPTPPMSNVKLPVLGTAVGGKEGSFVMNGEAVDYRPAPAALESVQGAFFIRATGESMYPRFIEGELLAIDPHRPVRKGDFCLIEMHGFDGVVGDAYVKMFDGYAGNKASLKQFNPIATIKIDRDKIRRIMHVYIEGLS